MNTNRTAPWNALPVLFAGAFMVVLDFFIVNVALPSIATDVGASESSLEWVVAGYGLSFAAVGAALTRAATLLPRPRPVAAGSGAAASA